MVGLAKYEPKTALNIFDDVLDTFFKFDDFIPLVPNNILQYDIVETENDYLLEFMLPGFKKENIKLDLKENNYLSIEAERKEIYDNYNKKGSFFGKYSETIKLPENINTNKINAEFKNGVLKLTLPKKEPTKKLKKQIEIK